MLTEIYIETLDEELADQVWEAWFSGDIDDFVAFIAWLGIACGLAGQSTATAADVVQCHP